MSGQVTINGRTFLIVDKPGRPASVSEKCNGNCGRPGRHRWDWIGEARNYDDAVATLHEAYGPKEATT